MTADPVAGPAASDPEASNAAASEPDAGAVTYEVVAADAFAAIVDELGELLADAVDSGASVNFLKPFSAADGAAWWRARAVEVAAGDFVPVVARVDSRVAGTAVLVPSRKPNSPHRAEVVKVLVHRRARRRGIGAGLMAEIERMAAADGRWLLILDTTSGSDADRFYRRLGWTPFGEVPNHALTADGALSNTTYFFRDLRA
ncbi:MAG TPA: GNAT family N-acetyltransferase [Candidatus Limnocylindrales bacterium]|jgi:GNAT superfamily N-acetyltransferase